MPLRARERERLLLPLNRLFFLHTCPESRIRHPYTHERHGVYFRKSGNLCVALLGHNELSSAYPLMTLHVRRPVIRPSFASVADTLREEFANKGSALRKYIYRFVNWTCSNRPNSKLLLCNTFTPAYDITE